MEVEIKCMIVRLIGIEEAETTSDILATFQHIVYADHSKKSQPGDIKSATLFLVTLTFRLKAKESDRNISEMNT